MRHETTDNLLAIKDVVRVTRAKSNGSGWTGHCPLRSGHNHGDAHPSLDIKQGDKFPTGFATYICRTVNDHTFKKLTAALRQAIGNGATVPQAPAATAKSSKSKVTLASMVWDTWVPLTPATWEQIRQTRPGSYMPSLQTLLAFDFREREVDGHASPQFGYPIGNDHLKYAYAMLPYLDGQKGKYEKRNWWTTTGFPQDTLFGLDRLLVDANVFGNDLPEDHPGRIPEMGGNLLIAEGQWDGMALIELGFPALALVNASQRKLSDDALDKVKCAERVFLVPDNDANGAGAAAMKAIAAQLEDKQITTHVIPVPGKAKDLCELVQKYGPEQTRAYLDWCIAHLKAGRQITHFPNGTKEVAGTASTMVLTDPATGEATYVIEDICAADMTPRRKKWLWRNRIPLGQTLFSGLPDMGKSTVSRDIAARVTRGEKFPDGENKYGPRKVIVLSSEEDKEDTYIPSLMAHGADLKQVRFATRTVVNKDGKRDERKIAFDRDLAAVEALIRKHDALLVIIDAFTSYLGNLRRNDDKEMRWLLEELNALAKRTGVAIISIGHFNKDGNKSGIHRISGAGALAEVPRAAWAFHFPPPEEEGETPDGKPIYKPRHHFMLNAKGNNVKDALKGGFQFDIDSVTLTIEGEPEELGRVKWGERTTETLESMLQRSKQQPGPKPAKLTGAKAWLKKMLEPGPMLAAEVTLAAEKADVNEFTLRDARQLLKVESYRNKGPHPQPYWWKLPGSLTPEGASVETNI